MRIRIRGRLVWAVLAIVFLAAAAIRCGRRSSAVSPYKNPDLPLEKRLNDLVARLTLEEKVSQMVKDAAALERLDIPAYDWWDEALHGVARAGLATVFPQAIGLAATWNTDLMLRVATAISEKGRAKQHEFIRRGLRGIYQGLTFWSPNINLGHGAGGLISKKTTWQFV